MRIISAWIPFPNPQKIPIIICPHKELIEYLNEKYGVMVDESNSKLEANGKNIYIPTTEGVKIVIWFERISTSPEDIGMVAHELFHLAMKLGNDAGIKHCAESEEVFSYLLQHIMVGVFAAVAKKSK